MKKILALLIPVALFLIVFPFGADWQKPGVQVIGWVMLFAATASLGLAQLLSSRR